jgi:hypothetical protein
MALLALELEGKRLLIRPFERLCFCWMLEALLQERPSFRMVKASLEGETVYLFTRFQHYLGQRWACLFVMGKGWDRPLVLSDKAIWYGWLNELYQLPGYPLSALCAKA